ncbi:MAG: hypothetical protein JWP34_5189 [Massilia sp.]|nr:hypothetical protein [Massilia sp.]
MADTPEHEDSRSGGGLRQSELLKKPGDWHRWKTSMIQEFAERGVYAVMREALEVKPITEVSAKQTSSATPARVPKAQEVSTLIEYEKVDTDPRMKKLLAASRIINRSVATPILPLLQGIHDPHKAWKTLESWAIGSGPVQFTNLITKYASINSQAYASAQEYCVAFDNLRLDLTAYGRKVEDVEYITTFVNGAAGQYPAWAERMRGSLRSRHSLVQFTLESVMEDLRDEAVLKKAPKSVEFNNYVDNKGKTQGKSQGKKKYRGPRYKPGECPHQGHSPEKCYSDHPELRPWVKNAQNQAKDGSKEPKTKETKQNEANMVEYSFMTGIGGLPRIWLGDSGSSCHIATNEDDFTSLDRSGPFLPIRTGGGLVYPDGQGTVSKVVKAGKDWKKLTLNGVYYCPGFSKNILSLQKAYYSGCLLKGLKLFAADGNPIASFDSNFILETRDRVEECYSTETADLDLALWHARLGHVGKSAIKNTAKATKGIRTSENISSEPLICEPCELGRSLRYTPKPGRPLPAHAGEEWHLDSVQIGYPGGQGEMWAILFTEAKYGYRKTATFNSKGEGSSAVLSFLRNAARQWTIPVKRIQVDGGWELVGPTEGPLKQYFDLQGIEIVESAPYTPEQNGIAERANRLIIEKARTWMIACKAPYLLWPYFWETAVDCTNFVVNNKTASIEKTPFEAFLDENEPGKPHSVDLSNLRIPGCKVFVNIAKERRVNSHKFDPVAEEGILLGWKGKTTYQVYVPSRPGHLAQQIFLTTSLVFHEVVGSRIVTTENDDPEGDTVADSITVRPQVLRTLPPNAIRKPRLLEALIAECHHISELEQVEPTSLDEALSGPSQKGWEDALFDEFRNMLNNGVFQAVQRAEARQKPLTARLVLKQKLDSNGKVDKLKVRLVARGFEQKEGVDFDQTFASVAKASTWRILLSIAASYDWEIHQIDVVSAFLNGDLDEEVYMEVPEGMRLFFDRFPKENSIKFDSGSNQVLRVLRSLYGLKQAPRQWARSLKKALKGLNFVQSRADEAIFINYAQRLIVCTYVDDFLVLSPSTKQIRQFKAGFGKVFKIKDLGEVNYFLGIKIIRDRAARTITLSQAAFAQRILEAKRLTNIKPAKTPLAQGSLVHACPREGTATRAERLAYASTTGSLMYLMTQTRVDYAFPLSVVSRYSHNPSDQNFLLTDHCTRYLCGTWDLALVLGGINDFPQPEWDNTTFNIDHATTGTKRLPVNIWTDSDWKGDKFTGKSTHSYVVQLGDVKNIVSWRSKRTGRVMLSSTEAEYYALGKGAQFGLWMKGLFTELRIPSVYTLKGDNQGSIKLSKNPEFHQRTGHIPLEEHFLRDEIEAGRLNIQWVPTEEQLADGLTKILPTKRHAEMLQKLGLQALSHQNTESANSAAK